MRILPTLFIGKTGGTGGTGETRGTVATGEAIIVFLKITRLPAISASLRYL